MVDQEVNIDALTVEELKRRLEELGQPITGTKAILTGNKKVLQDRLKAALELNEEENEEEDKAEGGEELSGNGESTKKEEEEEEEVSRQKKQKARSTMLTYRDVEDALETFSGDGSKKFERSLTQFEETADLCSWTDVQRIVYAKRLLRGSAKLFANYECNAKSWKKFRKLLQEEFCTKINSKTVHQQLSQVKKKIDETYRVLDIASHAEIELEVYRWYSRLRI